MADRFRIALLATHGGERAVRARADLASALPPASVGAVDEQGVFEVEVPAPDSEQALQTVWDAVAASGVDDHVVFLEHPDLPEHWRHRASAPSPG